MAQDVPPGDLARAVRALPRVGRLPSPWETRALPVLLEYRRHKLHEAMEGEELCTHWRDFANFIALRRQGPGCSAAVSALAAIEPSLVSVRTDDFRKPIGPMFGYELTDDFLTDDESDDGQFNHPAPGMFTITGADLMEAGILSTMWFDPRGYWE